MPLPTEERVRVRIDTTGPFSPCRRPGQHKPTVVVGELDIRAGVGGEARVAAQTASQRRVAAVDAGDVPTLCCSPPHIALPRDRNSKQRVGRAPPGRRMPRTHQVDDRRRRQAGTTGDLGQRQPVTLQFGDMPPDRVGVHLARMRRMPAVRGVPFTGMTAVRCTAAATPATAVDIAGPDRFRMTGTAVTHLTPPRTRMSPASSRCSATSHLAHGARQVLLSR